MLFAVSRDAPIVSPFPERTRETKAAETPNFQAMSFCVILRFIVKKGFHLKVVLFSQSQSYEI